MQVRPAALGDASDVALLLDTLGYPCTRDEAAERIVRTLGDPRHYLLLAEVDGAAAGLISLNLIYSLTRGADVARITALVVAPNCERQGVGRRLLGEVDAIARRCGASRLEVTSNPSRVDAHAFYRSCGYTDGLQHLVKLLGD